MNSPYISASRRLRIWWTAKPRPDDVDASKPAADIFRAALGKLRGVKAEEAVVSLPTEGTVLITVAERDRPAVLDVARRFHELGFKIRATEGTRAFLESQGIPSELILKMGEGRPNIADAITNGEIQLVINTPRGKVGAADDAYIRQTAIKRKKALIVDYERGPQRHRSSEARKAGVLMALAVPIVLRDSVVGLIFIDEPGERREFSRREVRVAEGIASQAGVAMRNARLYEESLAKAKSLEAVSQLGSLITSTLRMDDALEQIIDYSSVLLGAPSSMLMLLDGDQGVFRVSARDGVSKRTGKKNLPLACVDRLGLESPSAVYVRNLAEHPDLPLFASMASEGFVSSIVSAMYIDNQLYGLLMIQDKRELDPSEEDLAAFRLFANQAATAIKNARMYEEERRIAETLQHSLTQPLPDVHGLDIGIVYKSAFQAEQVGGDFYDVFEVGADLVAVLVGDVSGKGIKAAGLTETIRSSVRTLAYIDSSPAFVLGRLNQSLVRQFKPGTFATAVFSVVNISTGDVRLGIAGHPLPVLYCEGECHSVRLPSDSLLGAFDETYTESSLRLDASQMLLIYTDGLTEARNAGSMFGERRLLRAAAQHEPETPQALVDGLLEAATAFAQGRLNDDVALLALRLQQD